MDHRLFSSIPSSDSMSLTPNLHIRTQPFAKIGVIILAANQAPPSLLIPTHKI